MINIGEYIRKKRMERGLSARELARRSGVSQPYLSQLENGKNENPSIEILKKLAKALNISYVELMAIAGYMGDISKEADAITFQILMDNCIEEQKKTHLEMIYNFCKDFIDMYDQGNSNALDAAIKIAERLQKIQELEAAQNIINNATQDQLTGFIPIDED